MRSTARLIIAVIATLILGAAIGGVVLAQTPTPKPATPAQTATGQGQSPATSPSNPQANKAQTMANDFLNQLAQNLNISRATLDSALKQTALQEVQKAVANGKITSAQGTQITNRINSGQFPLGPGFGFGLGHPGGPGGAGGGLAGCNIPGTVASALGITSSELHSALQSGQTLQQIATAHGKTLQDIQTAVTAAVTSCVNNQVKAGTLTQTQGNNILQKIQQGIQNGHLRFGGPRGMGPGSRPAMAPASGQ